MGDQFEDANNLYVSQREMGRRNNSSMYAAGAEIKIVAQPNSTTAKPSKFYLAPHPDAGIIFSSSWFSPSHGT